MSLTNQCSVATCTDEYTQYESVDIEFNGFTLEKVYIRLCKVHRKALLPE